MAPESTWTPDDLGRFKMMLSSSTPDKVDFGYIAKYLGKPEEEVLNLFNELLSSNDPTMQRYQNNLEIDSWTSDDYELFHSIITDMPGTELTHISQIMGKPVDEIRTRNDKFRMSHAKNQMYQHDPNRDAWTGEDFQLADSFLNVIENDDFELIESNYENSETGLKQMHDHNAIVNTLADSGLVQHNLDGAPEGQDRLRLAEFVNKPTGANKRNYNEMMSSQNNAPPPTKWEKIAASMNIPVQDLKIYYAHLHEDLAAINSGNRPPNYPFHHIGYNRLSVPITSGVPTTTPNRKMNTGRWSPEEHSQFLEGHAKFGNAWARIAKEYVLTRTDKQVKDHATTFLHAKGTRSRKP